MNIFPHTLQARNGNTNSFNLILIYLINDPLLDIKVVIPLPKKKKKKKKTTLNGLLIVKILCIQLGSQNKFPEVNFLEQGLHIFNTVDLYVVFFSLVADFQPFESRYNHWNQSKVTGVKFGD